jgi:sugar phosphate isomerase/epimerase
MRDRDLVGATWSCASQDLLTALDILRASGFGQVEIWADGCHLDPRVGPDIQTISSWLRTNPLAVRSVHLPFDAVLPGAPAVERAWAWVDLCRQALDHAEALGARLAVAHPVLFGDPGQPYQTMVDRFVTAADEIAGHAERRGVRLALENMHTMRGPTLRSVAELRAALSRMDHAAGICVDLGHAVFNGYVDAALADQIGQAGDLLINSHVHDTEAVGTDSHLVPGDGIIDWATAHDAYRRIGYHGGHVLEVKGGQDPRQALRRARQFLLPSA